MQAALPATLPTPTGKPRRPKSYSQAALMQTQLEQDILDPHTKPQIRAACVRAWDILEERKRILRGKPLPGYLRHQLPIAKSNVKRVALLASIRSEDKESTLPMDPCPRSDPPGPPESGGSD